MKKPSIWTISFIALFYGNLAVAAQSISPATNEIPVTHQNTGLPQAGSDEPAETVKRPNSESTLEIPQALKGCWEVTMDGPPDSFQYIKGPQIGGWVRVKKTLCFIETASHSFQITYQTANADLADAANKGGTVSDLQSHAEVIGSDDKENFTLRSITTDQQNLGWLWGGHVEFTNPFTSAHNSVTGPKKT